MVSFRGDALHKVEAFRSDLGRRRVSLVVEQVWSARSNYVHFLKVLFTACSVSCAAWWA